jgi:hypothetical protein
MSFSVYLPLVIAIISVLATYTFARQKFRDDLQAKYDESLRNERIKVYLVLWKSLQPLAKYSRPGPFNCDTIKNLSVDLRKWYFETGGLFLTDNSRDAYFALQDELQKAIKENPSDANIESDNPLFERLRKKGSTLRTNLAIDVRTRLKSSIANEDQT